MYNELPVDELVEFNMYDICMTFLGHVMRKKGIEKLSLTGSEEGKRKRGRQRMTYLSYIKEWTNRTGGNELIQGCQDKEEEVHLKPKNFPD